MLVLLAHRHHAGIGSVVDGGPFIALLLAPGHDVIDTQEEDSGLNCSLVHLNNNQELKKAKK